MSRLICEAAVKRYARECRRNLNPKNPDLTVSAEYMGALERELAGLIRKHVKYNGSKRTMKADVFLAWNGQ